MAEVSTEKGGAIKAPRKRGRQPFIPSESEQQAVMQMAGMGYAQDRIALVIERNGKPIDEATLKRHFKNECDSAWNKDPVFGVIGIQSGPRG
jgi:hypothetical protein